MRADTSDTNSDRLSKQYLDHIFRDGILSAEEEKKLIAAWLDDGDEKARDRIVTAHARLVLTIAREFRRYRLPFTDIVQEGNVGLMNAVQKFDPSHEVRFATYAIWWIRANIQQYVLNNLSMVRFVTTNNRKRLFFRLDGIKKARGITPGALVDEEEAAAIAEEVGVKESDVFHIDQRMSMRDGSLNEVISYEGDLEFQDLITDERPDPEYIAAETIDQAYQSDAIQRAVHSLNERERRIISLRRLNDEPQTLEALSLELGVSRERIRQIERRAMEKMREVISLQLSKDDLFVTA